MQILPNVTEGLGLGLETCGRLGLVLGLGTKGIGLVSVSDSRAHPCAQYNRFATVVARWNA